jgi:hypothetical protein
VKEITPADMLKCVGREIKMRQRVYPKLVGQGNMDPNVAEWELAAMRAVYRLVADKAAVSLDQELPFK